MSLFFNDHSSLAVRQLFRACGRRLVRDSQNVALHRERLALADRLPGCEPVQGALADLFFACRTASDEDRRTALETASNRLSPFARRWFGPYVHSPAFLSYSPLATRWSVLVGSSLDVPRRVLRCSTDDSRQLVGDALEAWHRGDEAAQTAFLEHCCICRDTLAFLLARRAILRERGELPPNWRAVSLMLQQAVPT